MEKIIGLRIELNGFKGVITNIKELEEELRKAKQDLNELEIGSDNFKKLTTEISRAEVKLGDLRKTSEGIGLEKQLEGYGKLAGGITSSFAAAQAAVSLFGSDSTAVAEAAVKAQNLLTLALAARSIAEIGVGISTVKATIATKAQTIADGIQTTATFTLNGAMKSLFVTIAANPLGALVVVIGLVITAIVALSSAQDDNAEAAKRAADANIEYNKAVSDSANGTILALTRMGALDVLMKKGEITAAEYAAGLKDLGINMEKFFSLGPKGEKALAQFLYAQSKLIEVNKTLAASEEELAALIDAGDIAGANKVVSRITGLVKQKVQSLATIERVNNEIKKVEEDEKKYTETLRKNAEDRKKALLNELDILNELALADLKRFETQQKLSELKVEFEIEKQLQSFKELVKANEDYVTVSEKLATLNVDYSIIDTKKITDAENTITSFGVRLQNLQTLLDEGFKRAGVTLKTSDFKKLISEQFQIEQGVITDLDAQFKNFEARAKFEKDFIDQYSKSRIKNSKNVGDALKKEEEGYVEQAKQLLDTLIKNENGVLEYQKKVEDLRIELSKLTNETDNLKNSQAVLNGFIQQNAVDITKQYKIDIGDLKKNKEDVIKLDDEIQSKRFDKQKNYKDDIQSLEEQLEKQGLDIRKASYEEKLKLLKLFFDKEVKETEISETKKQEQYKKTIENINFALQTTSKAITDISSIIAQSFQIQLERLEYEYKDTMDNIVGDTKEASDKRLETEKSYQAQKAKIERNAQISALRFTLASTVAQGAQSIVAALTLLPPANIIVGALNAGITAAQVAIVQTQINDIQSRPLRRGGLLAMGGYISGASHEQGGVYAGGGYTLEGNESVINRQSTLQYSGLLSQINQSGGGRPIVVQSPMDSRLVEAIAKQKTEPIRAYVVEQDITRAQTINRRLEQLASF